MPDTSDANPEICSHVLVTADGGDAAPSVCSIAGDAATTITFVNHCTFRTVSTYWVDYGCGEVFYSDIAPDASLEQPTFVTHPWRIRDKATNELLKEVPPATSTPTIVMVP